jgi:hypothetical protein
MKQKIMAALMAAALLVLAGCGADAAQSGAQSVEIPSSAQSQPQGSSQSQESSPSSQSGEEAPEARLVMQVQEYHSDDTGSDHCQVEIPRLEGSAPGLEEINAAVDALAAEWEEFKVSDQHASGAGMEVDCYPYSNGKWVQAVVRSFHYPNYAHRGDMLSVNYDLENARPVTVDEALVRLGLTRESLSALVAEQDLNTLLGFQQDSQLAFEFAEVQAFRMREDGTAVFFLQVQVMANGLEPYNTLLAYDTRDGSFSFYLEKLVGEENPTPWDPPLAWEDPDADLQ